MALGAEAVFMFIGDVHPLEPLLCAASNDLIKGAYRLSWPYRHRSCHLKDKHHLKQGGRKQQALESVRISSVGPLVSVASRRPKRGVRWSSSGGAMPVMCDLFFSVS